MTPCLAGTAQTACSVVLAAIMLKLGAYGFLRFSLPIAPDASHEYAGFMITLSLIAVIYVGLVALVQSMRLIATVVIVPISFALFGDYHPTGAAGTGGALEDLAGLGIG